MDRFEPRDSWRDAHRTCLGSHVTMRLSDDRVIAHHPAARRVLARALLAIGRRHGLVALRAADNHIHAVVTGPEPSRFARDAETSLRSRLKLPVPFEKARVRSIVDQRHFYAAVRYVLRQEARHALGCDPLHEASNLQDLLGLRIFGAYTAERVSALLPRIDRDELSALLPPFGADRPVYLDDLPEAAAAAGCLADLRGRNPETVSTRRAAVHYVGHVAAASRIAKLLGVCARTVQRLRAEPVDRALLRAVTLQMRLRAAHGRRAVLGDAASAASMRRPDS